MDWTTFVTPTLGVGGLVLLAVILMLRGDLVPRKQVDALVQVKDQQISYLEKANGDLTVALRTRDEQLTEMMLTSRTTRRVLAAFPEAVSRREVDTHVPVEEDAEG